MNVRELLLGCSHFATTYPQAPDDSDAEADEEVAVNEILAGMALLHLAPGSH